MVTVTSSTSIFPKRILLSSLVFALLLPLYAFSQPEEDLRQLIFEAVVLPSTQDEPLPESSSNVTVASNAIALDGVGTLPTGPQGDGNEQPVSSTSHVDIERYRAQINSLAGEENPFSSQTLREQYEALALLLQQTGDHAGAIAALENAMHIDRVNDGLFTLKQIPLVESIITSHSTLGNLVDVNDYHEYLYYIQQKSFPAGDPRLLAAKEDWADWNVEAYLKEGMAMPGISFNAAQNDYVAIQNPYNGSFNYIPRHQLSNVMNPHGLASNAAVANHYANSMPYSVSSEMVVDERLRKARELYQEIIAARSEADGEVNSGEGSLSTDQTVELKLANVAFAVKRQMEHIATVTTNNWGSIYQNQFLQPRMTPTVVTNGYNKNRDALEQTAEKLEHQASTNPAEVAMAYINLGDWHVGFEHPQRSEAAYAKAWQILQTAGMDETAIAAFFAPRPLIPAPAFAIHDYSRKLYGIPEQQTLEYKGHVDLTLGIDQAGNVRGIKVDDISPDTSQQVRKELLDYLREQKMRPPVINGEVVAQADLKIRYYYTY